MPSQGLIIIKAHGEFDGGDDGGGGYVTEGIPRHAGDVDHEGNAAARPDINGCAARRNIGQRIAHRPRQGHGIFRHPGAQGTAGAADEKHRTKRRFAILLDALDGSHQGLRHIAFNRLNVVIEFKIGAVVARGADHQHAEARFGFLWIEVFDDRERIVNVGAAPARPRFRHLEITSRRRLPTAQAYAGFRHIQHLARLVFREHTGDVVVHHHDLIDVVEPLFGEHADGGGTATDAHALFADPVDDGRFAGLHQHADAVIDGEFDGHAVTEVH